MLEKGVIEKKIENKLVSEVVKRGDLCFKFTSPHEPGVPDRIVITPDGRVIFVELKAAWGSLANIQKYQTDRMRAVGADVRIIKGMDAVTDFVKQEFCGRTASA